MKRANSFTRGTGSCVPRGQANDTRGSTTSQQESTSSTSDLTSQPRTCNTAVASKIPRKPVPRGVATQLPQTSRIPLKRADVNSNVANRERSGKEPTVIKRTATADTKTSGIPTNSSKQTSTETKELSEPVISKQSALCGIPTKVGKKTQQHSGGSKIPATKQVGGDTRGNETSKSTEQNQNIDKENESALHAEKFTLKREGTGDELRVGRNDVAKSKLPRISSIPRSNNAKPSVKTRNNSNTENETKAAKASQVTKPKTTSLTDNKTNVPCARRELSAGPAELASTSCTLQRSDSGYGDTDSVSSKEDTPVTETGNEFTLSRENSKSKIPRMSAKSRSAAKSSRDGPVSDETKPKTDLKQTKTTALNSKELSLNAAQDKLEMESEKSNEKDIKISVKTENKTVCSGTDNISVCEKSLEINLEAKKADNIDKSTKSRVKATSNRENIASSLEANNGFITSKPESREKVESKEIQSNSGSDGKALMQNVNKSLQKPAVQKQEYGSSTKVDDLILPTVQNVSCKGNEKTLKHSTVTTNEDENKDNDAGIKAADDVSNRKQQDNLNKKQSIETSVSHGKQEENKVLLQKGVEAKNEPEMQALVGLEKITSKSLEHVSETGGRKTKPSPRKPPRLSKLLNTNDFENKQVFSSVDAQRVNVDELSSKESTLNKDVTSTGGEGEKSGSTKQAKAFNGSECARPPQDVGQAKDIAAFDKFGSSVHGASLVGGPLEKSGGMREVSGRLEPDLGQPDEVGQLDNEGVAEQEDPPRRSDNCMQCRMEQSIIDGEDLEVENGPGFRQYPTFISPRKSLVMCKHHAKQKEDTDMPREQPLVAMASFADSHDKKLNLEALKHKPEGTVKIPNLSPQDSDKEANTVGSKSPIGDQSRMVFPLPNKTERNGLNRLESLKTSENTVNESRPLESKTLAGPKGGHSPLLALSRDKKFAQNTKPSEDIKTALSLEWDDTGTELSPPNFSDDEEPGDLGDDRRPSVKLMNTNEALDKLKVIQSLIMKEAESRNRKESDESAGKSKKTGNELEESAGKYTKNPENEVGDFGGKINSTSNQVSPTLENPGRKASSPTIWDRITDRSTISQDQTTELLNETLAKLKASPKLSGNAMTRRTLSSRSLPGSRQASKEQLTSDGERPVYVYTSSWMNRSGKNSRGSTLSLCSNNRSLPSSRQNLTAREPGLKRSESAAGRMEKENGKRLEPKERKEYRLSDFDEINLSDDMSELRSQKATTPHQKPAEEEKSPNGQKASKKSKRSKKKSKNTAATMNNAPAYGASMEELADGKTTCQCGGEKCVIS